MKNTKILIAVFCIIIFLTVGDASAATCTKFVAKSGNDANPGTEAQPFLTIQKGVDAAVADDTVCVKSGTYYERVAFPKSGSAGKWITLAAYPGQKPVIDGTGVPLKTYGGFQRGGMIMLWNKEYIKISGFRIQNNPSASPNEAIMNYGVWVSGTSPTSSSRHIVIEKNDIYKTGGSGIYLEYGQYSTSYTLDNEDFIIQDNVMELVNYGVSSTGCGQKDGARIACGEGLELNRNDNAVIRNNIIKRSYKEAISVGASKHVRVYNNTITGGPIDYTGLSANGVGIYIACSRNPCPNADVEAYNNRISGRMNAIVVATEGGMEVSGIKIYNNIGYGNTIAFRLASFIDGPALKENIYFVNNVAYGSTGGPGIAISNQQMKNVVVRNNIAIGNSGGQITGLSYPGVVSDHNIVGGDPFVNAAGGDFRLKAGSSAIDAGLPVGAPSFDFDGNKRPAGAGFDIGAYEYCVGESCTTANQNPTPTCTDNIQNQGEIGTDCGGPCSACTSNLAPTQLILKPGWNQISSPLASGIDVSAIEAAGCVILPYKDQKLWAWNATSQIWINPAKIEPLKGYWIYAAYQCAVPLSGASATFTSLPLTAGWNKISAQGTFSAIQGTCAGHITGNWVWNWDKATEKWIHPTTMQLDKGYWIKVDQNCVLG